MKDNRQSRRSTGLTMSLKWGLLLWLALLLAGCQSTRLEEARIEAEAQTTTAQLQASAQTAAAQSEAQARIGVAQAQADAAKYTAAQQAEATKYQATQETAQTQILAGVTPQSLAILCGAILIGIVLWFRGRAHLVKVNGEVARLLPLSPAPSPMLSSKPQPQTKPQIAATAPIAVYEAANQYGADAARPGPMPGEWQLFRHGHLLLTMRPKQLTDSQGGAS